MALELPIAQSNILLYHVSSSGFPETPMGLSALVITYNEEANIAACLDGLAWVDEIVVVDAMSTDRTCEIAAKYTPRVLSRTWEGYAEARRYALARCSHEWVLSVDADERVTPELRQEIERTLRQPVHGGYLVPRKAFFLGRWIKHCGWYPGYVLRLFKKDKAYVTDRKVHEGMRTRGTVGRLKSPLLHYTYPSVPAYFARFDTYTSLAAQELHERGRKAGPGDLLARPFFQFGKMYFAKLGLLDGWEGLVLCAFSGFYVFVKYAKLRQMARDRRRSSA
jgi:glycosyltransferase involved in cell wall biosynthesis